CDDPLYANIHEMETSKTQDGYVMRGSLPSEHAHNLSMQATRPDQSRPFCSRATHSQSDFIAASMPKALDGKGRLQLKMVYPQPACTYYKADDTAYRLSTLWAKSEIEKLAKEGSYETAGRLAHAYRVVTSVSGATVLERESDYTYNGLDRNQSEMLAY